MGKFDIVLADMKRNLGFLQKEAINLTEQRIVSLGKDMAESQAELERLRAKETGVLEAINILEKANV